MGGGGSGVLEFWCSRLGALQEASGSIGSLRSSGAEVLLQKKTF